MFGLGRTSWRMLRCTCFSIRICLVRLFDRLESLDECQVAFAFVFVLFLLRRLGVSSSSDSADESNLSVCLSRVFASHGRSFGCSSVRLAV